MSKLFDEALKLKDICRYCIRHDDSSLQTTIINFTCQRADLGVSSEFCTKENYLQCTYNEVNMRSMPDRPKKGIVPLPSGGNACENPPAKQIAPPTIDRATGKPSPTPAYIDELKKLAFKDAGELKREALRLLNFQPSQVDHVTKSYDLTKAEPRKYAWLDVIQTWEKWTKEGKREEKK
jgi:hypothetical protein